MDGQWHKVSLQRYVETRSASGHVTKSWSTYATVWMKFRTLSGNERLAAQQVNAVQSHEVSMNYCASIVPQVDHRLVWGSRTFDIKDVRNVDELNRELRLRIHEVPTTGPVSSPSPSASSSSSPSASGSSSASVSPSTSASGSPSQSVSASPSASPSSSESDSPSSSGSMSPSTSTSSSPSQSVSSSPSGSKSQTPSTSPSESPSVSISPSPSASPSA